MDHSSYKHFTVSRGLNYHYFFSKGSDSSKPPLVLLPGFPSTSQDWERQVPFFEKHGYTIIAPDLLGNGGTDKPSTTESYKMSLMAKDLVDIFDHEGLDKVILIAYGWGSVLGTRVIQYFPARVSAFATFGAAFNWPPTTFDVQTFVVKSERGHTTDMTGYYDFYNEDGADKVIAEHWDSFLTLSYCGNPEHWKEHLLPPGALKKFITSGATVPRASYLSDEEYNARKAQFEKNGIAGALQWFKAYAAQHIGPAEDRTIPKEQFKTHIPVFFGATLKDPICLAHVNKHATKEHCSNHTTVDFDTEFQVQLAAPNEVNRELLQWLGGL